MPDTYCLRMYGAGHVCCRNGGHKGEHVCSCGTLSGVYVVTRPRTQVQVEVDLPRRPRSCWRCQLRARLLRRPPRHWNCVAPPELRHD